MKRAIAIILALCVLCLTTGASWQAVLSSSVSSAALEPFPSGMTHYWDASQVVESGGRVSELTDQIGAADFIQATGGVQPYLATSLDGKPVLSFPPQNNCFMEAADLDFNDRDFTVIIVRRPMMSIAQALFSGMNSTFDAYGFVSISTGTTNDGRMMGANKVSENPSCINIEVQGLRAGLTAEGGSSVVWSTGTYAGAQLSGYSFEGAHLGQRYHATTPLRWFYGDIYAIAFWDQRLSDSDLAQAILAMKSRYPSMTQTWTKRVLIEGDSIPTGSALSGTTLSMPAYLAHNNPSWQVLNMAVGGSLLDGTTIGNGVLERQTQAGFWFDDTNYTRNVLVLLAGRNDVASVDAATAYTRLVTVVNAYIAQGWEVYVCTLIDTLAASYPTPRSRIVTLNATIRSDLETDCTGLGGIIDLAANAAFDPESTAPGAAADTTYYMADGVHLNAAGNELMASLIEAVF